MDFESLISFPTSIDDVLGKSQYADKTYVTSPNTVSPYSNIILNFGANKTVKDWKYEPLTGGKIYINKSNNHSYRWSGTLFVDLDKTFTDQITTLNNITSYHNLGTITNKYDLVVTNQNTLKTLYSVITGSSSYRLSSVMFTYENHTYVYPIFSRDTSAGSFKVWNDSYLQTYQITLTNSTYVMSKVHESYSTDTAYITSSQLGSTITDSDLLQYLNSATRLIVAYSNYIREYTLGYIDTNNKYFICNYTNDGNTLATESINFNLISNSLTPIIVNTIRNPYSYYKNAGGTKTEAEFKAAFLTAIDGITT